MGSIKIICLLFLCKTLPVIAQKDSTFNVAFVSTLSTFSTGFATDNLGNVYLINNANQVKKINNKGDSVGIFNDSRRYGKIFSIDATNPLKLLVYYKEFATILVLDRFLNVRKTIDLRQQNIFQAKGITSSYDNNIWLFDELENKLKKIDDNGKVLLETADFRQIFEESVSPSIIFDRDGMVYLYDSANALITFDYYGARKNNFKIKGIADLQVMDKNTILGRQNDQIVLYKPALLQSYIFSIKPSMEDVQKVSFNNNRMYVLKKNGRLEMFSMPF